MRKWTILSSPLINTFVFLSFGFITTNVEVPKALKVTQPTEVLFPKNKTVYSKTIGTPPFLGSSYVGFKEALAFKESSGNYFITNTLGYLGKYQFGVGTLHLIGVYDARLFLNNPKLQEKVFKANIARNKWILRRDIKRFDGKWIKGVKVTESGMLAAAHLAGAGNVKKYLRSYGKYDVKDSYGTNIADYIRKFSGYDVSDILPKRNARI